MMLPGYNAIEVEVADNKVATITLNRPEAMNSFNTEMREEFGRLWPQLKAHQGVNVIVLRAAGGKAFSTGLDVKEHGGGEGSVWTFADRPFDELEDPGHELGPKRNQVWKPVIGLVDGMCAGGAFYWIAECDIVIASERATFFDPHVTYGMVAALEPIALSYRMRPSDVIRMALVGLHERMSADAAYASGLVSEVVESANLDEHGHTLAAAIASQPPAAVQGTVKAVWQALGQDRATALASALMYTQVGNPIGVAGLDRSQTKPSIWKLR